MFMNLRTYMIFCAAKTYENPQKSTRRVFSVNLSNIFLVDKLINLKETKLALM